MAADCVYLLGSGCFGDSIFSPMLETSLHGTAFSPSQPLQKLPLIFNLAKAREAVSRTLSKIAKAGKLYARTRTVMRKWTKKNKALVKSPVNELLEHEIKSLDELKQINKKSRLVAFDCEFLLKENRATEVGLACLKDMKPSQPFQKLTRFVEHHNVEAASVKIIEHYSSRSAEIARYHRSWPRESFSFGQEQYVAVERLEEGLGEIVQNYKDGSTECLVLVAYSMDRDIEAMRRDFPKLAANFSFIVDIRTIMRSTMACEEQKIPGIGKSLNILGYSVSGPPRRGPGSPEQYHNAGNDAVKTLAVLCGLMNPQNVKVFRASACVDLSMTNIQKGICDPPRNRENVVMLETYNAGVSQPEYLNSPMEFAAFVTRYTCPKLVGISRKKVQLKGGKNMMLNRGWAVMPNEGASLDMITATNGKVIHGTCLKSVHYTATLTEAREAPYRDLGGRIVRENSSSAKAEAKLFEIMARNSPSLRGQTKQPYQVEAKQQDGAAQHQSQTQKEAEQYRGTENSYGRSRGRKKKRQKASSHSDQKVASNLAAGPRQPEASKQPSKGQLPGEHKSLAQDELLGDTSQSDRFNQSDPDESKESAGTKDLEGPKELSEVKHPENMARDEESPQRRTKEQVTAAQRPAKLERHLSVDLRVGLRLHETMPRGGLLRMLSQSQVG
ncbi:hypothetical protein AB5N19_06546 [Seiridium cardinale]|uniref:Gfd2/YDR514C-like C-terminal domain-containing protein n=1 Tax=Seiridium cardinale TaxID=138064 RepID=A0ABR2XZC9_9PEZI